jgi:2-polyprenyl-6-methoxyphenol hydroxylase-like FAD-dependent oxidoreductase
VFESAQTIRPLGVGINLLPHAVRVLDNLGLLPLLEAAAIPTAELIYFNKFGQQIWRGLGPCRALRLAAILDSSRSSSGRCSTKCGALGGDSVHTGCHLRNSPRSATESTLASSTAIAARQPPRKSAIFDRADGIHSAARPLLSERRPPCSRARCWRDDRSRAPFSPAVR